MDFTFETVMSHPGKVELLAEARSKGYRTYLYYVATDDSQMNISRVQNRVATGGHDVPSDKVEERYHRSLAILIKAIANTYRADSFDNSTDSASGEQAWLAEVTGGYAPSQVHPPRRVGRLTFSPCDPVPSPQPKPKAAQPAPFAGGLFPTGTARRSRRSQPARASIPPA